jgi:hypothetical protein
MFVLLYFLQGKKIAMQYLIISNVLGKKFFNVHRLKFLRRVDYGENAIGGNINGMLLHGFCFFIQEAEEQRSAGFLKGFARLPIGGKLDEKANCSFFLVQRNQEKQKSGAL